MKKIIGVLFLALSISANAQYELKLYPSFENMGYQLMVPTTYDTDNSATARIKYREPGGNWQIGMSAEMISPKGIKEFRGSLFNLKPNTVYEVEVTLTDSTPTINTHVFTDTFFTRKEIPITPTSNKKFVSPSGSGTAYTEANPGNLKTLLSTGLTCGTTVILKGGTYEVGSMALNLSTDCSETSPIILMAAPGEKPILDAAERQNYTWTQHPSDTNIWFTNIPAALKYNALCMMDTLRLYPYALLFPNNLLPGYPSLSNLGYDWSGYYRLGNTVYIKTLDKKNPNNASIIFSNQFTCLSINGNNKQNFLYIKGLSFKYYGKGRCDENIFGNPVTCYPSFTLNLVNCNNVIVDSCDFEYCNYPVSFDGQCNNNTVQRCNIIDQTGYWSHGAFKQSRDQSIIDYGSYGRYLENAGIAFTPGLGQTQLGNIVRYNTLRGIVGGVVMGANNADYLTVESEIYDNKISFCYDGVDNISLGSNTGVVNARIFRNRIHDCPVIVSLISPSHGPFYIYRNQFYNIAERKNHNDIFFLDCNNVASDKIWGTGFKLNASTNSNPNAGSIFSLHNTFHSKDTLGFNMYLWGATWKKLISTNNIYYTSGKSNLFFDGIKNDTNFVFISTNDNFYNASSGPISILQPINGQSVCYNYFTTAQMDTGIRNTTSNLKNKITSLSLNPDFNNLSLRDFSLKPSSDMIDAGLRIVGFNDSFQGSAPDIGAIEGNALVSVHSDNKDNYSLLAYPNPSAGTLHVQSENEISLIEIFGIDGRVLQTIEVSGKKTITLQLPQVKGILLVKATFKEGNCSTQKVVNY